MKKSRSEEEMQRNFLEKEQRQREKAARKAKPKCKISSSKKGEEIQVILEDSEWSAPSSLVVASLRSTTTPKRGLIHQIHDICEKPDPPSAAVMIPNIPFLELPEIAIAVILVDLRSQFDVAFRMQIN